MTVYTAGPSTVVADSNYTPSTSTVLSCVSDGSDATYGYTTASSAAKTLWYAFNWPASSGIKWRYRMAVKTSGHTTTYPGRSSNLAITPIRNNGYNWTTTFSTVSTPSYSTTATWKYGAWIPWAAEISATTPFGAVWQFNVNGVSTGDNRVHQLQVELETTSVPSAPTVNNLGAVTATSTAVTWVHTDTDGWAQAQYEVKVFDSATYSGGGFNASTSTPVWTEKVSSPVQSTTIRELGSGVTYRVYVRTAKNVNGTMEYGAWGNNTAFTPVIPAPGMALTATWDTGTQSMLLSAKGQINLLAAGTESDFETSVAGWANTTNVTVSQSTTQVRYNTYSMRMSSNAAGSMTTTVGSYKFASPGVTYVAQAYTRAGSVARTVTVAMMFYDSGFGLLQTSTGTGVVNSTSNFDALPFASGTAPANTVYVKVSITVAGTAGASELHYIDGVLLAPNSTGTAVAYNKGSALSATAVIQRTDPGVGWRTVRGASAVDLFGGNNAWVQQTSVTDYESRRGVTVYYRLVVTTTQADGSVVSVTALASASATSDGQWWMKVTSNPALNAVVQVQNPLKVSIEGDVGVFRPLDADGAVAVTGAVYGEDGEYTIISVTDSDYTTKIRPLMMYNGTILVQDALGRHKWIRWTNPRTVEESSSGGQVRRTVTLGYIEVLPDSA